MPINDLGPVFRKHAPDGVVSQVGMTLLAWQGDHYDAGGSAVAVAEGVLLTARHVFEDYYRTFHGRPPESGGTNEFYLQARQFIRDGTSFVTFDVRQIVLHPASDLALLYLRPRGLPADYVWRNAIVDLAMPAVGERLCAFGYCLPQLQHTGERVELRLDPATAVGDVVEAHRDGRDSRLAWPCVRTNARFDGGMSGGPVFGARGTLVGVVCSNLPPSDEGDEHVSYVSSLWPLVALAAPRPLGGFTFGEPLLVREWDSRLMTIANRDAARVELDDSGEVAGVAYRNSSAT